MKNHKNYFLIGIIGLVVLVACGIFGYNYLNSNRLSIIERRWVDENSSSSTLISLNVINNADVFGNNGKGVFYDFLTDFENEYSLKLNKVAFEHGGNVQGVSFNLKKTIDENKDVVFYKDHYVLIGKKFEIVNKIDFLNGKEVNILTDDVSYVSSYIGDVGITFKTHKTIDDIFAALEDTNYAIVPLHFYLEDILSKSYSVIYHFGDINCYYTMNISDDILSSILRKFYSNWDDKFKEYYNDNLFSSLVSSLGVSETEVDAMQSIEYDYGFINNSPYEVISSGNYGGIVAIYLKEFMDVADVDFKFTKYRNFNKFNKAVAKGEVDVYFGYNNAVNAFAKTESGIILTYSVIANSKNNIVINSINSLVGKTVYVDKNSKLYNYLTSINGIIVKTYDNNKELVNFNNDDELIVVDSNIYNYYHNNGLENYTLRYSDSVKTVYDFNFKNDNAMYKLFNKYISIIDSQKVLNAGFYNHYRTVKSGNLLSLIAKYFINLLFVGIILGFIIVKRTKKIKVAKKIKKDDKMKFIDQLTLLKNRNYLNENIKDWNNNTIYPQTILVVDLNRLQEINDIQGYEEGDKQIKAAANSLIKTQLDNSDIIRTNGNEFVIYLVGYSQRQITNYIHKLNKEFKKLPYNYGAEFGYSMILDDIKTIEDALNEATKSLKKQKELNESKNKE